jgi:hypothetical protein
VETLKVTSVYSNIMIMLMQFNESVFPGLWYSRLKLGTLPVIPTLLCSMASPSLTTSSLMSEFMTVTDYSTFGPKKPMAIVTNNYQVDNKILSYCNTDVQYMIFYWIIKSAKVSGEVQHCI